MRADPLLVAVTASLLSVPVLVEALAGDRLPVGTALTRVAVLVVLSWVGVAALGALLRATAEPPAAQPGRTEEQPGPSLPEHPVPDVR